SVCMAAVPLPLAATPSTLRTCRRTSHGGRPAVLVRGEGGAQSGEPLVCGTWGARQSVPAWIGHASPCRPQAPPFARALAPSAMRRGRPIGAGTGGGSTFHYTCFCAHA